MRFDRIIEAAGPEDVNVTFLRQLYLDRNGTKDFVKQADVTSISWNVYDGDTQIGSGTLTVANVIFDTPQTGTIWDADPTAGYNFKAKLLASNFPNGGRTYRVQFIGILANADQDKFVALFDYQTADVRGQ